MSTAERAEPPSGAVDHVTAHRFRRAATAGAVGAAAVAIAGMLSYLPGLQVLGIFGLDYLPMAASTGACLLILAAVLFFLARRPWQGAGRVAAMALVLVVALFGLLETIELFIGVDISFEDWLVPVGATVAGLPIRRMSPVTGAALTVAGLGAFLLLVRPKSIRHTRFFRHVVSSLGVLTLLAGATVLLTYLYGAPLTYGGRMVPMAATSAIALVCVGIAEVALAGPKSHPVRLIVGGATSARLSRAFFPLVVIAVTLHGILSRLGRLSPATATDALFLAILAIVVGVSASYAITRIARATGRSLDENSLRLRESEARYRAITQSASDAIITSDADGLIVSWNPSAERVFGQPAAEAIGSAFASLMTGPSRAAYAAALRGVTSVEVSPTFASAVSLTGVRRSGDEFPMEVSLSTWSSDLGRFFTGIIRDVTAHQRAVEALRESEFRWEFALEGSGDGLWDWDVKTGTIYYSRRWKEMLGYADDEIGDTFDEWSRRVHPDDLAQTMAVVRAHLDGETPRYRTEHRLRCKDGSWMWILDRGVVVSRDAGGHALRAIGTHSDITERKLSAEQLRLSEERLAITLQSIGDAVIATDELGFISRMNTAAERLTGWPIAEAAGRQVHEVFRVVDTPTRMPVTNPVSLVLERGEAVAMSENATLVSRDGREYQISDSTAPIRDSSGVMVGAVLVFNDVSEEYRVRRALAESADLLERTGALARIGGWKLDLRTDELVWTQETRRIHELDPGEALSVERAIGFYAPEARPVITAAVQAAIDLGTPFDLELPLTTATGRAIWVRAQGSAVLENGKVVEIHGAFQDITERRQAREALRASEEWHRTIVETAMAGFWLVDAEGRLLEVNETYCRMSGYSAQELSVMRIADLEVRDSSEQIEAMRHEVMTQGEVSFEGRHRRKDGTLFDVDIKIQYRPVRGGLFVTLIQDITARKQAAEATAKSEELFRTIFAEAPLGVAVVNSLTGHIHEVNARFAAIAGRTEEEMETLDWMSITHPDDVQEDLDNMARMNAGEIPGFMMVKRYRRPDGSYVWINMTIAKMTLTVGGHPHHLCMIEDITDRRRREEELRTLSRAVRQSPVSIVITDRDGNIEYVNPRFEQITGYTRAEAIGSNPRMLKSGITAAETYRSLWAVITAGGEWRGELCNRRKNGELFWEQAAISGLKDERGQIGHFVAVKEDVTDRKREEQERAVLQAHLMQMQKMESIGLLAGGVAHDFNNMLAAILGYAELTMLSLGSDHDVYPWVAAIRTAAERSADLTGRLLAFARKQTIAPKVLVLNDTVNSLLTILGRMLGERVKLVWMPDASLWTILADPTHVDQVLTNLAVNSRDAMVGRDAVLEVSTSNVFLGAAVAASHPGAHPGEYVRLRFADNGCGMDAATLSHLFEPFFTTKPPGEGTGLGLATVHGIMMQHGGFVDVESTVGIGTTFHLYFPRASQLEQEVASQERPPMHGTETILVAEDEEGVRASTAELLRMLGYTVFVAANGDEAVAIAAACEDPIHLLLTDVIMPGLNGAQLRDALTARIPALKVLFMSGYAGNVISSQGVLAPGTHFVQKPFTMRALAAAVRMALDE